MEGIPRDDVRVRRGDRRESRWPGLVEAYESQEGPGT